MAGPDATAIAALDADYLKPAFVCYLDILGEPIRATTWPADLTFSGTGDPDLDGNTFEAIRGDVVKVGEVRNQEGGAETLTISLSGLILPDNDLLNALNDEANWRGRVIRLWQAIYNENDVQQGAYWNYYTGRMVDIPIVGDVGEQTIELQCESYLASLTSASNRTYLDQEEFDPLDFSAAAAIAIANGTGGNGLSGGYGGVPGGGGVRGFDPNINLF